jgi:hypothetical protein
MVTIEPETPRPPMRRRSLARLGTSEAMSCGTNHNDQSPSHLNTSNNRGMNVAQAIAINTDRLAKVRTLKSGGHSDIRQGACVMEAVAYVAGEPWSDHPECVCPVLGAFMRAWNDGLPSDADRARLLLPRGSAALAERRSLMAADWLVRVQTPAWLKLAGLTAQAATLEALPEITSMAQAPSIRGPLEAVRRDAAAAGDAARAAARAAATQKLAPTRDELQLSALALVERMIAAEQPV